MGACAGAPDRGSSRSRWRSVLRARASRPGSGGRARRTRPVRGADADADPAPVRRRPALRRRADDHDRGGAAAPRPGCLGGAQRRLADDPHAPRDAPLPARIGGVHSEQPRADARLKPHRRPPDRRQRPRQPRRLAARARPAERPRAAERRAAVARRVVRARRHLDRPDHPRTPGVRGPPPARRPLPGLVPVRVRALVLDRARRPPRADRPGAAPSAHRVRRVVQPLLALLRAGLPRPPIAISRKPRAPRHPVGRHRLQAREQRRRCGGRRDRRGRSRQAIQLGRVGVEPEPVREIRSDSSTGRTARASRSRSTSTPRSRATTRSGRRPSRAPAGWRRPTACAGC